MHPRQLRFSLRRTLSLALALACLLAVQTGDGATPASAATPTVGASAPVITSVWSTPFPRAWEPLPVWVGANDEETGGSPIVRIVVTVDGGPEIVVFDDPTAVDVKVKVEGEIPPVDVGPFTLCARATDAAGNTSAESCQEQVAGDPRPPVASELTLVGEEPVAVGDRREYTLVLDDRATGGDDIRYATMVTSSELASPTGSPHAVDGAMDSPYERAFVSMAFKYAGTHEVCVIVRDRFATSEPHACITVDVLPRSASGHGTTASHSTDPLAGDEAEFAFDLVHVGPTIDDFVGEVTYSDGLVQFEATEFTFVSTIDSTRLVVLGHGLWNGVVPCMFSLRASEPDGSSGRDFARFGISLNCEWPTDRVLAYETYPTREVLSGEIIITGSD